eukprot:scaffold126165_cov33-Tisochrysis_lutea.AAC.2
MQSSPEEVELVLPFDNLALRAPPSGIVEASLDRQLIELAGLLFLGARDLQDNLRGWAENALVRVPGECWLDQHRRLSHTLSLARQSSQKQWAWRKGSPVSSSCTWPQPQLHLYGSTDCVMLRLARGGAPAARVPLLPSSRDGRRNTRE